MVIAKEMKLTEIFKNQRNFEINEGKVYESSNEAEKIHTYVAWTSELKIHIDGKDGFNEIKEKG